MITESFIYEGGLLVIIEETAALEASEGGIVQHPMIVNNPMGVQPGNYVKK